MTTAIFFLTSTIFLLLWIAYARFDGFIQAYLYFYRNLTNVDPNDKVKYNNLHDEFTWQRAIVAAGYAATNIIYLPIAFSSVVAVVLSCISLMLVFSFYHNGQFYSTRNDLDENVYKLRWRDASTSSTAKWEFSYKQRREYLIAGFILHFAATAAMFFL